MSGVYGAACLTLDTDGDEVFEYIDKCLDDPLKFASDVCGCNTKTPIVMVLWIALMVAQKKVVEAGT